MKFGPSAKGDDKAFDRSPASDLWRTTLRQIPTIFGRMVFLSTLRDVNTGAYVHYGFALRHGEEVADATLKQSHRQCFAEWLAFSLEQQKADLDLYLSGIASDRKTILETWARTKPYRNLTPTAAIEVERRLYDADLEALLGVLMVAHGVSSLDQDA